MTARRSTQHPGSPFHSGYQPVDIFQVVVNPERGPYGTRDTVPVHQRLRAVVAGPDGDALLVEVGQRLQACVRASDTVARLGGDEFAVVLEEVDGPDAVREVAARICADMARPFELADGLAQIGASVGVVLGPDDAANATELMRRADAALYAVKKGTRGAFRFYEEM